MVCSYEQVLFAILSILSMSETVDVRYLPIFTAPRFTVKLNPDLPHLQTFPQYVKTVPQPQSMNT